VKSDPITVKHLKEWVSMLDESYDNKVIKVVIPPNAQEGDYDLAIVAFPNMAHVLFGTQVDY
jgi:hypothetical protein